MTQASQEIGTSEELASLYHFNNVFGLRAKQAAAYLARLTGLDEAGVTQFVDGLGELMKPVEFEQRHDIELRFKGILGILTGENPSLDATRGVRQIGLAPVAVPTETAKNNGDGNVNKKPRVPEGHRFPRPQRHWLSALVDQESVDLLETMPVEQRLEFGHKLSERYQSLSVKGLSLSLKERRPIYVAAFLRGQTYGEIAEEDQVPVSKVSNGLRGMAATLVKNVSATEIAGFIPRPEEPDNGSE